VRHFFLLFRSVTPKDFKQDIKVRWLA